MESIKKIAIVAVFSMCAITTQAQLKIGSKPLEITSTSNLEVESTNGTKVSILKSNGNVGIGNVSPSEALEVIGNLKFSGALMPNNSAGTSGQVLTSAGMGFALTWTTFRQV